MKRTKVVDALKCTDFGKDINVKGWVRSHRSSKAVDFIALNDGSTINNSQVVVDPATVDAETLDSLKATHQLVVTLEEGSKDGGFGERIASYYGTSEMKVMVGGIRKGLYDRYDVKELLSDNRLLDEQIVEDILLVIND